MSRPVTLFSGYGQKENRTTNYCLLILKMLYEANPGFLAEVLSTLFGEELDIGVRFDQQQRKASGVPDGVIAQSAFTIYIETKNFNWFYDAQLERHLADLSSESAGQKFLLALGKFEVKAEQQFENVMRVCRDKHRGMIRFSAVGFEEFIGAIKALSLPKSLADATSDLEDYLDSEELLPTWKTRLDVVNCAGIPNDILEGNVYMCPASGGAYNHQRARFFGMYKDKTVSRIAEINGMVELRGPSEADVKWRLEGQSESKLMELAHSQLNKNRPGAYPTRVFVLGELYETDFRKNSAPMRTSKQYFDISPAKAKSAADLADWLKGRTWEEMR